MRQARRTAILAGALAPLLLAGGLGPADASPAFNQRFEGRWVGAGTVQRESDPEPRRVTCTVDGEADAARIALAGTCRAMLIFTRAIGADLAVDGSGTYRGVYVGARVGPAQLSGEVAGDRIELAVRFPEGVGGGRQRMIIENPEGSDRFTLRVTDVVDGQRQEITNLVFERQ
ncbi:hypothetical protein [Salinarimonas ramus]|uniref:Uncharacterized protein n=1 Tax=Salinarimonas ramus TaxID=690164 RepID=A0A917QB08_9HYPH|nr:hypothetical protein [Salinarimonas ramus]GGK40375.1 hypothetical protein GCM10011322_29400 [Salinarimonas ramus]